MEEKRFTLRMDGELFEEIVEYANKHRRSTAKEIELAIAKYLYELKKAEITAPYRNKTPTLEESENAMKEIFALDEKYRINER